MGGGGRGGAMGVEPWGQEPWVHDKPGRGGRVCAGWGWGGADEEWDQEPWVHEKHGGVRGGLGQGKEYAEREGRMGGARGAWVVGVGQAGGHALGAA